MDFMCIDFGAAFRVDGMAEVRRGGTKFKGSRATGTDGTDAATELCRHMPAVECQIVVKWFFPAHVENVRKGGSAKKSHQSGMCRWEGL
jgi:hypothetical protein